MTKIEKKITGYKVLSDDEPVPQQTMHEGIDRPIDLTGKTYKIKTPQSEHALYITINDMVIGGVKHPYEIFINSKNMAHFQWILAMTRLISAIWRKGGNADFLIDELKAVFDPQGGYWKKSIYYPSIVAEIGHVIERHLKPLSAEDKGDFPATAVLCPKCNVKALVRKDNCEECLNCGESKCS